MLYYKVIFCLILDRKKLTIGIEAPGIAFQKFKVDKKAFFTGVC
jgi:hypothetical protein